VSVFDAAVQPLLEVEVHGDRAYARYGENVARFMVLDVSDPAAPAVIHDAPIPNNTWTYDIFGDTMIATTCCDQVLTSGLQTYSIADETADPVLLGQLDGPFQGMAINADATAGYYGQGNIQYSGTLVSIDLSDPAAPALLSGDLTSAGNAGHTYLFGDQAVFTIEFAGEVFDVSDPAAPVKQPVLPECDTTFEGQVGRAYLDAGDDVIVALGSYGNDAVVRTLLSRPDE
jgi:hypothetical protein